MASSQTVSTQIFHRRRPHVQDVVSAGGDKSFVVASGIPTVLHRRICFLEPVDEASAEATTGALRNALQGLVGCVRDSVRKAETDGAVHTCCCLPSWIELVYFQGDRSRPPCCDCRPRPRVDMKTMPRRTQFAIMICPNRAFSDCLPVAPKRDQRLLKPLLCDCVLSCRLHLWRTASLCMESTRRLAAVKVLTSDWMRGLHWRRLQRRR